MGQDDNSDRDDPTQPMGSIDSSIHVLEPEQRSSGAPTAPMPAVRAEPKPLLPRGSESSAAIATVPGEELLRSDRQEPPFEGISPSETQSEPATIRFSELPQGTQDLLANVAMASSMGTPRPIKPVADHCLILGSILLLGPLGSENSVPPELENVLELREIAAPRRAVMRRAIYLERGPHYEGCFMQEAELARQIVHSNLVRTYHCGRHEGTSYLIREFVPGLSLAELCDAEQGARLTVLETLAMAFQLTEALSYLHHLKNAQGESLHLIHGAVSPSSILVSQTGQLRLTEPSLCFFSSYSLKPNEMSRLAHKDYSAPEQNANRHSSAASDWFSLGMVMAELLLGNRPLAFGPAGLGVDLPLLTEKFKKQAGLPAQLGEICLGLLSLDEGRRIRKAEMLRNYSAKSIKSNSKQSPAEILRSLVRSARAPTFVSENMASTADFQAPKPSLVEPVIDAALYLKAESARTPLLASSRGPTALSAEEIEHRPRNRSRRLPMPWFLMLFFVSLGIALGMMLLDSF